MSFHRLPYSKLQPFQLLGELEHSRKDGRTNRCQLCSSPRTIEELYFQGLFEHLNLLRERRLRHIEPLRGTPEMPFLGHRKK